jgi:DNA-binding transcriptional regulator GbsR (MarR family)
MITLQNQLMKDYYIKIKSYQEIVDKKSNEIKTRDIPKNKKYQLRVLEYSNEVKSKINDGNDRCIFYSKTPLIM